MWSKFHKIGKCVISNFIGIFIISGVFLLYFVVKYYSINVKNH